MSINIDIEQVEKFYKKIEEDQNHRYKSWEHCFNYFLGPIEQIDSDKASLHLAFYLASWGMYRGSSYLLQKDYLIHKRLVETILLNNKYQVLKSWNFSSNNNSENIELLFNLNKEIKNYYYEEINKIHGEAKEINVSDVLSTKIILGTFGCVPAYDRFFIEGLRESDKKFGFTFNEKSFNNLIAVYKNNSKKIDQLSKSKKFYEKNYPVMKIIDMYFWQRGFEVADIKRRKKREQKTKIIQYKKEQNV